MSEPFQFVIGILIGVLGAISGGYLLFQTKAACREQIEAQCAYHRDMRSAEHSDMSEIKEMLKKLQCELVKQQKILMSIIVALPVNDEVKHQILKG